MAPLRKDYADRQERKMLCRSSFSVVGIFPKFLLSSCPFNSGVSIVSSENPRLSSDLPKIQDYLVKTRDAPSRSRIESLQVVQYTHPIIVHPNYGRGHEIWTDLEYT
jgi:hypothetical protein